MKYHGAMLSAALLVGSAPAQETVAPLCEDSALYHQLDFWIGDWDVYIGKALVGHDRVEKVLQGCAVVEHWSSAAGGDGMSLFFVDYDRHWAQVWVTGTALMPGGVKEKVMVDDPPPGTVRFQGVIRHPEAGSWLDRTTLTPHEDGSVGQRIEVSQDGGTTWNPTFDALYRPAAPSP